MDEKTIQTYDASAKEYDDETTVFWDLFPPTFPDEFARVSGQYVLDVGSGPGRDGLMLQARGKKMLCLDASTNMVEMSRARGLESVVGDLLGLPFEDALFDAVWAYTSLLHIPKSDIHSALQEIVRVLKPGGILGLGMIEGTFEGYRESSGMKQSRWFCFYEKGELETLLQDHGFTVMFFETITPGSRRYLHFICRKTG